MSLLIIALSLLHNIFRFDERCRISNDLWVVHFGLTDHPNEKGSFVLKIISFGPIVASHGPSSSQRSRIVR